MADWPFSWDEGFYELLCPHVARQGVPILHAARYFPVSENDSGWVFHCGADHQIDEMLLVQAGTAASWDPEVAGLVDLREGHMAERERFDTTWVVAPLPAECWPDASE